MGLKIAAQERSSQRASPLRANAPASSTRSREPAYRLQSAIGNSATARLFRSGNVQCKLTVSRPEDESEREADRVADKVMRMPEPLRNEAETPVEEVRTGAAAMRSIHRAPLMVWEHDDEEERVAPKLDNDPATHSEQQQTTVEAKFGGDIPLQRMCAECEEEPIEDKSMIDAGQAPPVLRKSASALSPHATPLASGNIQSMQGGGSPLPPVTRAFFEPRFGVDFGQVRVHTGAVAEERARSINAKAFTLGSEITFAKNAFAPGTHEGRRLLAHELAHVVQQSGADPTHAEQSAGQQLMRTGIQIQRWNEPDKIIELRGKAAEQKLGELGGKLATDPDYSDGRKAIAGSYLQLILLFTPPNRETMAGVYQWTHVNPEGSRSQSLKGMARPDLIPSAAPGPGGMFVNAYNIGATTLALSKRGTYKTELWVRAVTLNNGVQEGYELHIEYSIEVVHLFRGLHEAHMGLKEPGSYEQFRDMMDMQTALLRPSGPTEQNRGHQHQITTNAKNPTPAAPGSVTFTAQSSNPDKSKRLSYHWYVSPQTNEKPPQRFAGRPIVAVAGRTGYDFGVGPSIAMPTALGGFWVVWYQARDDKGTEVGEASYFQTILSEADLDALEDHDKYMERLADLGDEIEGERVPIKGVHVSTANGRATQLRLFIGKKKGDPSQFVLIDVTPGLDPKTNRFKYSSSTSYGVIQEFLSNNKYPEGMLQFGVGNNKLGIDGHLWGRETTGRGFFDRLSTNLSIGGMVALGVGILAAPFTRGQSLQVAMVVSGALTAAGSAVSLYERLQHAEVSTTGVAIDVMMIVSSLINAGSAIRSLRGGPAVLLANRTTRFLLWSNFAFEGASALLISVEGAQQLAEIIDNPTMNPDQKRSAVIRIVTNLILSSTMLALSYGQMKSFRNKMELTLGKTLSGKLSDELCMTLSVFEDATLKTLRNAGDKDLIKLAGAVRQEPALINVLKSEKRLLQILPLMKANTADDLRFAIVRTNAHEAGVSLANSDRLVNVLKAASFDPPMAMNIPKNTLGALGKDKLLDDLEALTQLAQSGKIKNYPSWLGELTSGKESIETAAAWAAGARVAATTGLVDMLKPWGIDFAAWKTRLLAQGVKGDLDAIIRRAKGFGADALAARGELRAAERARARGIDFEFVSPPAGKGAAQGEKSPEARIVRGGEARALEVKTATEPPKHSNWNAHADKANKQIKSAGKSGEIWFDWTEVDVRASTSDFKDRSEIERFMSGKMTKDRLKEVRYFEILWKDNQGKVWITSRTRAADGTLGPVTTVMK